MEDGVTIEEAWRQYELANVRIDRCKAADDRTGLAIAEGQADHWLAEFIVAEAASAQLRLVWSQTA
jgi:hypothetical protein